MFARNILLCLAALSFALNAEAFFDLPVPVGDVLGGGGGLGGGTGLPIPLSPEQCKKTMSLGFKPVYRTSLIVFLRQSLLTIESVAIQLRDALPDNPPVFITEKLKLTAIAEGARLARGLLDGADGQSDDKLGSIVGKVNGFWIEIQTLNAGKTNLSSHTSGIMAAFKVFQELIFQTWSKVALVAKVIDTSQLKGFDSINRDVEKAKVTQGGGGTSDKNTKGVDNTVKQNFNNDLIRRILLFFGIDNSMIVSTPIPILTPDQCKNTMSQGFKPLYKTSLIAFLRQGLLTIETAAIQIRDALPDNPPVFITEKLKLTAIAEGARLARGILDGADGHQDDKLGSVLAKFKQFWAEIHQVNTGKVNGLSHLEGVVQAWRTLCAFVVQTWSQLSVVTKVIDTSQLSGFDAINKDVGKVNGLGATADNQNVFSDLFARILVFFNIDRTLIFSLHY